MLFDTHTHLNEIRLFGELDNVYREATKAGVSLMLVPSYDIPSCERALLIANKYQNVYAALGIHPSDVKNYPDSVINDLENLLKSSDKVKALGEIGLDYHWDTDPELRSRQRIMFIKQIELANNLKLPVIIHMRDADEDTVATLKATTPEFGFVMHCYSGSLEIALELIKLGGYISLGGPVTFTNAKTPKEIAKNIPLSRLLIETDSPYLAPHPFRGQMNYPSYIKLVCEEIANTRGITPEEVAKATRDNACNVFHVESI